jgi:hypothetical protein
MYKVGVVSDGMKFKPTFIRIYSVVGEARQTNMDRRVTRHTSLRMTTYMMFFL